MLKRLSIFCLLFGLSIGSALGQQRSYDELEFPELNEFQQPDVTTFTTANGIRFFLVEDHELPLIDLSVRIRTGEVLVPDEKTGLASMTGTVMRSGGTENYPADTLNQILEYRAASMETGIGFSSGSASMNVLKEDFGELLPIFIDLLRNPAFPQDKIDLAKTQTKSNISRRNDNPQQVASRVFQQVIYGESSIYARNTEYETVNNITREDMMQFHEEHFTGENMMVGVIGDFETSEMRRQLEQAFGALPAGEETTLEFPEVDYDWENSINLVDKPDVTQSTVIMGHIGGMRDNPDYPEVQVMNQVLSGGFSGRLMQVVRTEMGLAYTVSGSYGMGNTNYPGVFTAGVGTQTSTTAEAIDAVIEQIERLRQEPIPQQELQETKEQFLNSLVFRYTSYEDVLNERMSYAYLGLPEDTFDEYVEGVRNTTVEDVQRVAQEYMHPDSLQILVVGNKSGLGDQLQKYGEVNEIDISIPQPGQDSAEAAPAGDPVRGAELLSQMSEALIAPGTQIDSLSVQGEVTLQGQTMQSSLTINYPDAIRQTVQAPTGTLTMSYSGGQGTLSVGGQSQPLPQPYVQSLRQTLNRDYLAVAQKVSELESRVHRHGRGRRYRAGQGAPQSRGNGHHLHDQSGDRLSQHHALPAVRAAGRLAGDHRGALFRLDRGGRRGLCLLGDYLPGRQPGQPGYIHQPYRALNWRLRFPAYRI
ncbi:MAG: pitrilysin family protein [Balneolaceae bacterium]|nr:pitrilysin family protein [Balneolaceae bacterium]